MSTFGFDLGLGLGRVASPRPEVELADRVRSLLSTTPGTLPWAPTYGCNLHGILGRTADSARLDDLRYRVSACIAEWVPEAEVKAVETRVVQRTAVDGSRRDVPFAERAMASLAISAVVEIEVVVSTPYGLVHIETTLDGEQ